MVKKFAPRYTNNDALSRMVHAMKQARKSSGYTQEQFGKLVGLSRETVVHIEGLVECTVLSLECEVLKRWYAVCASKVGEHERDMLQNAISAYLFSHALPATASDTLPDAVPGSPNNNNPSNLNTSQQKVA